MKICVFVCVGHVFNMLFLSESQLMMYMFGFQGCDLHDWGSQAVSSILQLAGGEIPYKVNI